MHMRLCFSAFQEVFNFVSTLSYGCFVKLLKEVLEELGAGALLLPLAQANIRWSLGSYVAESDATPTRQGVVQAPAPTAMLQALYRCSQVKSEHVRLDWADMPDDLRDTLYKSTMTKVSLELENLLRSMNWQVLIE